MPEEIGFIGLGNMGGRMAVRLAEKGRSVVGYDVFPGLADKARARVAGSIAAVAARGAVVLLSLPDSKVVESVVYGDGGLLAVSREGQVIADLSTAAPASTRELHKQFAAKGVSFLDAGVSGGAAAAEAGTLTVMVGGDQAMLERIRPVLDCIAAKIFYCGAPGSGHTAKLLNNFLNAVCLAATAEAMVAGKKAGLDMETLLNIINSSSGVNFASMNRFTKIIHGDYLKGGLTNTLMMKDVMLYTELIADLGVAGQCQRSAGVIRAGKITRLRGPDKQQGRGCHRRCVWRRQDPVRRKRSVMIIVPGRSNGAPTSQRGATFTGTVWADPVVPASEDEHRRQHRVLPAGGADVLASA